MIAVYDFGGGTFDAAVLRKAADGFEILGQPEGMERLGGIDFDEAVFAHVLESVGRDVLTGDGSPAARSALTRLRDECRGAKESLSEDTEATIPVLLPGNQSEVRLTRAQLEDAIRPRIRETVAALERSVRSAGLEMAQVDRILLIGGCSRIPLVGQTVRELTGRPVTRDSHPKHGIALGAALFALGEVATAEAPAVASTPVTPIVEVKEPVVSVPAPPVSVATAAPVEPPVREPSPQPRPGSGAPQHPARAGLPRWAWAVGGLLVIVAGAAIAALLLSGGGASAEARITDAKLSGTTYTVFFETEGVTISSTGDRLVFYWNNLAPETGVAWAGGSPVTLNFQRPSGGTKVCVAILPASGAIKTSSGNCWTI